MRVASWALTGMTAVVLAGALILLGLNGDHMTASRIGVYAVLVVVAAGAVAAQLQAGKSISGGIVNALDAAGVSFPNPLAIFPRGGWFAGLLAAIAVLGLVCGLLALQPAHLSRWLGQPER
jgi:hypothetical protein